MSKMTVEEFENKVQKLRLLKEEGMLSPEEFYKIKMKLMEELKYENQY